MPRPTNKRRRLESALCALVDFESDIVDALTMAPGVSGQQHDLSNVCAALRAIVDDGFKAERR